LIEAKGPDFVLSIIHSSSRRKPKKKSVTKQNMAFFRITVPGVGQRQPAVLVGDPAEAIEQI
jgi:hypothetical protein